MALLLSGCGHTDHSSDGGSSSSSTGTVSEQDALQTATPIKHLVVIFGENESFDHYFGTYPNSSNPSGEPTVASQTAPANVATVNAYARTPSLLTANPNANATNLAFANGNATSTSNAVTLSTADLNPFRIDPAQFDTASQNHAYTPEQQATHNLAMDLFIQYTGRGSSKTAQPSGAGGAAAFYTPAQVMGYFDGNTVTALWNFAQAFAMNDNAFTDSFGPSTPGAINVVSGSTGNATTSTGAAISGSAVADGQGAFSVIGDPDPTGDVCSKGSTVILSGKNIGDLLTAAKITWGGFMGGFDLTAKNANGTGGSSDPTVGCARSTVSPHTQHSAVVDYIPHHAWFQYFASTQNKNHTRPSSTAMIGHNETNDAPAAASAVNHQYDYNDFVSAVSAGNFPSVSYIKAPAFQDAHPGNSNPLDEQDFVAKVMNFLQQQPDWKNTAVIITYDDSDGWYDHYAPNILNSSFDATVDQMNSAGNCTGPNATQALNKNGQKVNGRCGPGTRIPFMLISPYAKVNYVDSTPLTQASVIRFIEDNWLNGARIGGGSDDSIAGSIMGMFDFQSAPHTTPLFIDSRGMKTATAPSA